MSSLLQYATQPLDPVTGDIESNAIAYTGYTSDGSLEWLLLTCWAYALITYIDSSDDVALLVCSCLTVFSMWLAMNLLSFVAEPPGRYPMEMLRAVVYHHVSYG